MNTSTFLSKAVSLSIFTVILILTLDALGGPPAGFDFTVPQDAPYEPGKLLPADAAKKRTQSPELALQF